MADQDPTAGAGITDGVEDVCGSGSPYNGKLGLRVGALFIILVTSMAGTLFPILAKRSRKLRIPSIVFQFTKYFGGGVIVATAFIHLLAPALEALGSECLTGTWTIYPWALAIAMMSIFGIFILELVAHRFGVYYMERLGIDVDTHGPGVAHGPERPENAHARLGDIEGHHHEHGHDHRAQALLTSGKAGEHGQPMVNEESEKNAADAYTDTDSSLTNNNSAAAQIIGVAILEAGVVVHSVIIGLTLAVTDEFDTLFVVIIFHQTFEGLGLGTRLAYLPLPSRLNWVPLLAGAVYACCTPLGMAIGLGVRTSYNPESARAAMVSGVLDAISAGILLWTGLVELLAHEFIFNDAMRKAPASQVAFGVIVTMLGAGIMSLLGRWA